MRLNLSSCLWECHGCHDSGNAYHLALRHGKDPAEAKALAERYGLWVETSDTNGRRRAPRARAGAAKPAEVPPKPIPVMIDGTEYTREDAAAFKAELWQRAPGFTARLWMTCGWSAEVVRDFGVGYNPLWDTRVTVPLFEPDGRLYTLERYWPPGKRPSDTRQKMLAAEGPERALLARPDTFATDPGLTVFVEGWPAALAAESLGFAAVGVPSTSWKWERKPGQAERFAGRDAVVWPDADEEGRRLARGTAEALTSVGCSVRIYDPWPGRDDGHDVGDWLRERIVAEPDRTAGQLAGELRAQVDSQLAELPVLGREDGDLLLRDLCAFLGRFVVFPSPHELLAVALWVLHTHALDAAEATPYLVVQSAERGSGKTHGSSKCSQSLSRDRGKRSSRQ